MSFNKIKKGPIIAYHNMNVAGTGTFNNMITALSSLNISGNSTMMGASTFGSTLNIAGIMTASNQSIHSGASTFGSTLFVSGNSILSGVATCGSTLNIMGTLTAASSSILVGASTIGSSLNVSGNTTMMGPITTGSSLNVSGNTILSGVTTIGSTLNILGATTITSSLNISGNTIINGTSTMLSNLNVSGTANIGNTPLDTSTALSVNNQIKLMEYGLVSTATTSYSTITENTATTQTSRYMGSIPLPAGFIDGSGLSVVMIGTRGPSYSYIEGGSYIQDTTDTTRFIQLVYGSAGTSGAATITGSVTTPLTASMFPLKVYKYAAYPGWYVYDMTVNVTINYNASALGISSSFQQISTLGTYNISDNRSTSSRLYINSAGNIGIGNTAPSALLHVSGNSIMNGSSTIGSTLNITGALNASSTSILYGASTIGSTLNIIGALTASSTSILTGASTVGSTFNIAGAMTAANTSILSGASTAGSTFNVIGALTASSTSILSGASTVGSTLNVTGALTAANTSILSGAITMGSTLFVSGNSILEGASTHSSTLNIVGSMTVANTSILSDASTVGSTLNVVGALTASSTSILLGPTTTGSTLNVVGSMIAANTSILSGATTIGSTLNIVGAMTAGSTLNVVGALSASSTSILSGAITTGSTLNVAGAMTAANTSILSGATTIGSTLNVSSSTYLNGNVGIGTILPAYKLDVSGDINYTGNFYKNGTLVSLGSKQSGSWNPGKSDMSSASKTVMSSNGIYQMLVGNNTNSLFLSSDSGNTWSALTGGLPTLTGSSYWSDGVISATGQYIVLSVHGGSLWMSSDYGKTFALTNQPTPNIWLPLNGSVTDIMGISTVTTPGTVPGYVTVNYPGYTAQAVNLANTAGSPATRYIRGTWTGAANFTVSFWFNAQTVNGAQQTLFTAYTGGYVIYINGSNQIVCYIPNGGASSSINGITGPTIISNTWYYVNATFQTNGTCSLYVNNSLPGTYTNSGGVGTLTTTAFCLGTYDTSTANAFNGYIDDVKITNTVSTYVPIPLLQPNIWMPFENSTTDLGSNAITPVIAGSLSYVPGIVGLNAVNLVNTAGGTGTNYIRGSITQQGVYTISCWFNMQSYPANGQISVITSLGGNPAGSVHVYYYNNNGNRNGLYMEAYTASSTVITIGNTSSISLNTWYHVHAIYQQSGTCSFYINGSLIGSLAGQSLYNNPTGFGIGTYSLYVGNTDVFNGYIDDYRIYYTAVPIHSLIPQNYKSLALSGTGQYALASTAAGWVVGSSDLLKTWSKQAVSVGTQSNIIQPNIAGLAMTQWSQNGVNWVASASSIFAADLAGYKAFDNTSTTRWASSPNLYVSATGIYSGSTTTTIQGGVGSIGGEWLQLQSNVPLVLQSYAFTGGYAAWIRLPRQYYIVGSNDGTTWYPLQYVSMTTNPFTTSQYVRFKNDIIVNYTGTQSIQGDVTGSGTTTSYSTSTNTYLYFRLIYVSLYTSNDGQPDIGEWQVNFARPSTQSLSINHTGQYQLITTGPVSGNVMPNSTVATTNTWVAGGVNWVASASSVLSSPSLAAYGAFNNYVGSSGAYSWGSASGTYSGTSPFACTSSVSTTILGGVGAIVGEWLQLQSSVPLVMLSYSYTCGGAVNIPQKYYIVGSNDGSNWYPIQYASMTTNPFTANFQVASTSIIVNQSGTQTITGAQTGSGSFTTYSTTTNAYTYFRFLATNVFGVGTLFEFGELYINFQNSVSYSTNYGSTWLNTVSTVSNEMVALSPSGPYVLSTNSVAPFARLTLDNTNIDMQGNLTPTTGAGTVTYSSSIVKVGTYSAFFNNTASGAPANYLNYTVPTALNNPPTITMTCWMYPTSAATNTTPMALCGGGSWGNHFYINSSSIVNFYWASNNSNGGTSLISTTTAPLNTWTHLCMTYTGSLLSLYVNGVVVASTNVTGPLCLGGGGTLTNVLLGCGITTGNSFAGYVDDVRIYTSALNADEINALYQNPALTQTVAVSNSYLPITSYTKPVFSGITSNIVDCAVSETGQYMIAVTSGTTNNLYYSTDFGATFTTLTIGTTGLVSCAISYDGSNMTVENATTVYTLSKNIVSSQWTTSSANIYYNTGNVGVGTSAPSVLFHISGTSILGGASTMGSTLNINGAMFASSTSILSGASTHGSSLNIVGSLNASSTSILSGAVTTGSSLNIVGSLNASSTSILSGATTVGSSLNIVGSLTASSTSILSGATTLGSTLNITGATTINSTLNIIGSVSMASRLNISGTTSIMDNLGIGTNAPTHRLHLGGGDDSLRIGAIGYIGTAPSTTFGLERSRNQILFSTYRDAIPNKIGAKIAGINRQTYTWSSASEASLVQSTDLVFFTVPQNAPYGYDDTVERMRIIDNGSVGIGTSGPSALLHVSGTSILSGASTLGSTLNIMGALTAATTSILSGASTISSTLNVAGTSQLAATNIGGNMNVTGGTIFNNPSGDTWQTSLSLNNNSSVATYSLLVGGSGNGATTAGIGGFAIHGGLSGSSNFRLNINSNGNVGINNPTPSTTLDVVGTIQGQTAFQSSANASNAGLNSMQYVYLGQFGAAAARGTVVRIGDILGAAYYISTGSCNLTFYKDVGGVSAVSALQIVGTTVGNTTPNVYVPNNLGVGTSTPGYKLDVTGDINFTGNMYKSGVLFSGSGGSSQWTTSGANIYYNTGNVGIGTTTPSFKLHISGTVDGGVEQYNHNTSAGTSAYSLIGCRNNTPSQIVMFINSSTRTGDGGVNTGTVRNDAGDLRLQATGAVNGIHIKGTTGNVGIGTTAPVAILHIASGDNSKCYYGPNSTWGGALYVGAGPHGLSGQTAQVVVTNGNLHLDCGTGTRSTYINFYTTQQYSASATTESYGTFNHRSNMNIDNALSVSGNITGNEIYTNNWFRVNTTGGLYWQAYGYGIQSSGSGGTYGNISTYGTGKNSWSGYDISGRFTFMANGDGWGIHDTTYSWALNGWRSSRVGIHCGTDSSSGSLNIYSDNYIYYSGQPTNCTEVIRMTAPSSGFWSIGIQDGWNTNMYFASNTNSGVGVCGYVENDSYGTRLMNFTGQHRCAYDETINSTDSEGLVVRASGQLFSMLPDNLDNTSQIDHITIDEALPQVTLASTSYCPSVFGVVSYTEDTNNTRVGGVGRFKSVYMNPNGEKQRVFINSLGEGGIWVCNIGGVFTNGDYITSSDVPGYGMKQNNGVMMNYTVGKITIDCDFTTPMMPVKIVKKKLTTVKKEPVMIEKEVEHVKDVIELDEITNRYILKKVKTMKTESVKVEDEFDLYDEEGKVIGKHKVQRFEYIQGFENDLDANGMIQWIDNGETKPAYKTRYLRPDGTIITKDTYDSMIANGEIAYIAAFVSCTYHCG